MTTKKPDFWTWFDSRVAEAVATDDGTAFAAAGLAVQHTGGGCMAWERDIGDTGWFIMVTDSGGSDLDLDPADPEDCWLVGAQNQDGDFINGEPAGRTAAEALAAADKLQAEIVAGRRGSE